MAEPAQEPSEVWDGAGTRTLLAWAVPFITLHHAPRLFWLTQLAQLANKNVPRRLTVQKTDIWSTVPLCPKCAEDQSRSTTESSVQSEAEGRARLVRASLPR